MIMITMLRRLIRTQPERKIRLAAMGMVGLRLRDSKDLPTIPSAEFL